MNVGLTMAHCYSDLSRLPAKVEQGGCGGVFVPPATGIQRVRGSGDRRMATRGQNGVIFLMEGVSGDLRRVALFLRDTPCIVCPSCFSTLFSHLLSSMPPSHVAHKSTRERLRKIPEKSPVIQFEMYALRTFSRRTSLIVRKQ